MLVHPCLRRIPARRDRPRPVQMKKAGDTGHRLSVRALFSRPCARRATACFSLQAFSLAAWSWQQTGSAACAGRRPGHPRHVPCAWERGRRRRGRAPVPWCSEARSRVVRHKSSSPDRRRDLPTRSVKLAARPVEFAFGTVELASAFALRPAGFHAVFGTEAFIVRCICTTRTALGRAGTVGPVTAEASSFGGAGILPPRASSSVMVAFSSPVLRA